MKRIAYFLLASLTMIICACNASDSDATQSEIDRCPIPENLNVFIQNVQSPNTKISVGELNPDTNTYPITFTPSNPDAGVGDFLYLYGLKGDISGIYESPVTLSLYYYFDSSYGNMAHFKLENMPAGSKEGYEEADYFILFNEFDYELVQNANGEIGLGLTMVNWFTKEQFVKLAEGESTRIPMYPLNSLLKIHLSYPPVDHELTITDVYANTPGQYPRKYPDFSRLPEMLRNQTIYSDDPSNPDYTYTSIYQTFTGKFEHDVYVAIDPGVYESMNLEVNLEDDEYTYCVKVDSKKGFEIKPANVYTSSVSISNEMLMASRTLIPVVLADGNAFSFTDPDEGKKNIRKLRELLATAPVVLAGLGLESDFAPAGSVDVHGKIAVVSRGDISFVEKIINAENAGALGIIIYNNQPGDLNMDISALGDREHIPAIATVQDFGTYLNSHPDAVVSVRMDD